MDQVEAHAGFRQACDTHMRTGEVYAVHNPRTGTCLLLEASPSSATITDMGRKRLLARIKSEDIPVHREHRDEELTDSVLRLFRRGNINIGERLPWELYLEAVQAKVRLDESQSRLPHEYYTREYRGIALEMLRATSTSLNR
jgi:hypothetical protein